MAEKPYFTQDTENKVVIVDTTKKPAQGDTDMIQLLLAAGYTLKKKSQKRAQNAADRARKDQKEYSDAKIKEDLKDKPELLKKYENIKAGKEAGYKKGYFAAKAWYKEEVKGINPKGKKK